MGQIWSGELGILMKFAKRLRVSTVNIATKDCHEANIEFSKDMDNKNWRSMQGCGVC